MAAVVVAVTAAVVAAAIAAVVAAVTAAETVGKFQLKSKKVKVWKKFRFCLFCFFNVYTELASKR
jgi:hypothetical protein